jgi:hypothetical protein
MGSGDNFITHISEKLHIANVKEAYRFSNKVNYIQQMPKCNDQCAGLDYIQETLSYPALQGQYDIDSAKDSNQVYTTNTWRSTGRAHLLCLQTIEDEPIIRPVSHQVYHFREMLVRCVCRCVKLTSLRDGSEGFQIPNLGQLFRVQMEED